MNKRSMSRIFRSLVLMALLLSSLPVSSPALSQAPIETPVPTESPLPPGGGVRLTPPAEPPAVEAPTAPAVTAHEAAVPEVAALLTPDAPDTCGSDPTTLPFGQDLELLLGPVGGMASLRLDQPPTWAGASTRIAVAASATMTGTYQSGGGCIPGDDEVAVYRHSDYGGACSILRAGLYPDEDNFGGLGQDSISSIKFSTNSNVRITIYEDRTYTGKAWSTEVSTANLNNVYFPDTTDDVNDEANSIKVSWVPRASGNIAAVAGGTDRATLLYKTGETGELALLDWDAATNWSSAPTRLGLPAGVTSTLGNPALVSRGTDWIVFARYTTTIQYKAQNVGIWGNWGVVSGISAAASDPVVVAPDANHLALFYKSAGGTVYFAGWEAGRGWRSKPVSLGKPGSAISIASELNAIARDENHIAVFGVGSDSKLYVKEWSTDKPSDWSGTAWVPLMDNVNKAVKPAVASRYTGQMGVAVLGTSSVPGGYTPYYREWTVTQFEADSPSSATRGWKAATSLSGGLTSIGLAGTAVDELFAYGVNTSGAYNTSQYTETNSSTAWAGWVSRGTGLADQVLAAAVGRPHDLMLIGRATDNHLQYQRYTNQNKAITATPLVNLQQGGLRSQVVATVQGQTYWFSAYLDSIGQWTLEARNTSNWALAYTYVLTGAHGTNATATNNVSLAAGDLDRDGDDEVLVATTNSNGYQYQVSVNKLAHTGATITGIQRVGWTGRNIGVSVSDVQVAVGDLDGDGIKSEFAVAVRRNSVGQVFFRTYKLNGTTIAGLTGDTFATLGDAGWDLEMAIGQVQPHAVSDEPFPDRIVFTSSGCHLVGLLTFCGSQTAIWQAAYVATEEDGSGSWQASAYYTGLLDQSMLGSRREGPYSSALATGDVDSDGLDEIIIANGNSGTIGAYNVTQDITGTISVKSGPSIKLGATYSYESLAAGDVDGDGRVEVVYTDERSVLILKQMFPNSQQLTLVGQTMIKGVPLLADLDGDSAVATWQACNEFTDYHVLSVANAQPMWYQNGEPAIAQMAAGGMGNNSGATSSSEDAWSVTLGGSVSVGFEHEFIVPLAAVKLGEVRASVTQEFMGSLGHAKERTSSTTVSQGSLFGGNGLGFGSVCYTSTSYSCSKYTVARPGTTYTTTAMTCRPAETEGVGTQTCSPLEDWYGNLRTSAGPSWVPVGHHTTNPKALSYDVSRYPVTNTAPVSDSFQLWWVMNNPINISGSTLPGNPAQSWNVQSEDGTAYFDNGSFDANTTVSAGATMMDVTVDASFTAGFGKEWSSGVGWTEGMEFSGDIYHYAAATGYYDGDHVWHPEGCPLTVCKPYSIVPYVYKAQARTEAGLTYPYFEQDYYVSSRTSLINQAPGQATTPTVVGLVPQSPVITSTSHPVEGAWYPTNTVTLEWGQPVGDASVVIGYEWNLDNSPATAPTAAWQLTTTHTYPNLADGVYYLHIRAVGDAGDRGPVTHRAIRVDANAPQVTFLANPFIPNGLNGWYNTAVTVTVVTTDTVGAGLLNVETSTDGTTWLTYTHPVTITTNTPGRTLWARATDNLGHTSDPISTTIKLDKTKPTTVDSDGYGLSYANVMTDEVGNAQLVLGGAIKDALSGRLQVEVKAGSTGQWNAVSEVGDLPMPPDNEFTTAITTLNWIYTPTFEIRGVYPLWARGVDAAGNHETAWEHGYFWWQPDDVPVLNESRVSVSTQQTTPGGEVAFTIAARNSGYQEAQLLITDTIPAGLTVLPYSISDAGLYDPNTGVITWTLHALWPGQTRYLFFSAVADGAATPVTLTNQVDLMAYWPWLNYPGIPDEPARHYYSMTTALTVVPGSAGLAAMASQIGQPAPRILGAAVLEGDIASDPQVTLLINAISAAHYLYVREWTWDGLLNQWNLAQESGWVPFEAAPDFEVTDYLFGRSGQYHWTLSAGDGVKYLGIWVADANGQISSVNEGNLIYTNLVSDSGQQLVAGQPVQYRLKMNAGQLAILSLVSLSGDADLYIWKPRAGFKPNYYSNGLPVDQNSSFDTIGYVAPEEGVYVVEVQAVTDAYYRLVTAGDLDNSRLAAATQAEPVLARLIEQATRQTLPLGTHLPLAEKERPAHPGSLSTPFNRNDMDSLATTPEVAATYWLYLPLIAK